MNTEPRKPRSLFKVTADQLRQVVAAGKSKAPSGKRKSRNQFLRCKPHR